jgi:hypothetical protein
MTTRHASLLNEKFTSTGLFTIHLLKTLAKCNKPAVVSGVMALEL